jgi:transcriptional regulator with XRE-family HTH domain
LREAADLSQGAAGKATDIGQRKLSRFENGLYAPDRGELDALLRVYRADENTADRLRELVRARLAEPRKTRAAVRRSNVAAIQHRTRLLEEKAQTIEAFQPSTVVGLVQSKAFVRAVFGQPQVADAEQAISERLARQRQIVGSDKQVTIIPWTQPLSRPLMSGFRPFDRTVLAVSSEIGEVFIEDPTDLAEMSALFDQLTEWADFGEAAAEIARRFAAGYRSL